jgi:surface carbohydrate biosynthesis protein
MNMASNNKLIFIFPIEVKNRELISKIFLAYKILKIINCRIIIGNQRNIFNNILKIKDTIWLDKNTYYKKIQKNKLLKNNIKFLLDEEGPNYLHGPLYSLRINKNIINFFHEIFVWGENDYNLMNKINNNKKIHIFGHPKFDILQNKKYYYFDDLSKKIKKKYGNFILIASSFSDDATLNPKIETNIIKQNLVRSSVIFFKKLKLIRNIETTNYIEQILLAKQIALKFKKTKVIYRPHPYQNIELVKKRFGKVPKNLNIIYEGNITPWINASKIYVHSGCTTSFEAYLLKKPIIFYYKEKSHTHNTFKLFGNEFTNSENLIEYINRVISKNIFFKSNNRIFKIVENFKSNNYFYKKFINLVKKKYLNLQSEIIYGESKSSKNLINSTFKKILSFVKNKIILKSFLINFLPENFLYSKEYKMNKFNQLSKKELSNYLNYIDSKSHKTINIFKVTQDVYELSRKL